MKVACPKCGVTLILVLLEFQNGELMPCKLKCPKCSIPLESHKDFAVREGKLEPRLLMDAPPAGLGEKRQQGS